MTFWKVDMLNADIFTQRTHWFWNSSDAAVFCDSLSGDVYENAYHCHEVQIPDVVVDAARRQAQAHLQRARSMFGDGGVNEVKDRLASACIGS